MVEEASNLLDSAFGGLQSQVVGGIITPSYVRGYLLLITFVLIPIVAWLLLKEESGRVGSDS